MSDMASVKTLTNYSIRPSGRGQQLPPLFLTSNLTTSPLWTVDKKLASLQPMYLFETKQMSNKQLPLFSAGNLYAPIWKRLEEKMYVNNFGVATAEHTVISFSSQEQIPSMSCVPLRQAGLKGLTASKHVDCSQYFSSSEQYKPSLTTSSKQNHCSDNVKTFSLFPGDKKFMNKEVIVFKGNSAPQNFLETPIIPPDLMAPRKTAKKGRPSSRKQKKRQRAKTKERPPSSIKDMSSFLQDRNHLEQSKNPSASVGQNRCELQFIPVRKTDSAGTSQKPCSITNLFLNSQKNLEMKDNRVDQTDKYRSRQKNLQPTGVSKVKISPPKLLLFSCGLNLNTIFSQSNNSVNQASVITTKLSPIASQGSSDHIDIFSPGISEISPSPVSSANNCDLILSQDISCSQQEDSLETLALINAQWDKHYPDSATHNDSSENVDAGPVCKVHFAPEADLLTVHFVGTEDRGGTWHLLALDRARFMRRIQEIGEVISPVLEVKHRAKVLNARQGGRE